MVAKDTRKAFCDEEAICVHPSIITKPKKNGTSRLNKSISYDKARMNIVLDELFHFNEGEENIDTALENIKNVLNIYLA